MRPPPLTSLTIYGLAAVVLTAAVSSCPAPASAEAVVSLRPARPAVLTHSEADARPLKDVPGVFVYHPDPPPPDYPPGRHAPRGSRLGAARVASAAGKPEPSAWWVEAGPVEWAAQGGAAVLLYGLSRKGRRRRRRVRHVRW